MRTILLIGVVLYASMCYAQNTYRGTIVNQIDDRGMKQGLWIAIYKNERKSIQSIGCYIDDKKTGTWTYYSAPSDVICSDEHGCVSRIEEYNNDGSVDIVLVKDRININQDSTVLKYFRAGFNKDICIKEDGRYNCTRYNANGTVNKKKVFLDFDDCLNHLNTKW